MSGNPQAAIKVLQDGLSPEKKNLFVQADTLVSVFGHSLGVGRPRVGSRNHMSSLLPCCIAVGLGCRGDVARFRNVSLGWL